MHQSPHAREVLMLAAENAALKGGKVGGMADVIRDLPAALAKQGVTAHIVMPDYGFLAREQQAEYMCEFPVHFDSGHFLMKLYRMPNPLQPNAIIYLIAHQMFVSPGHAIYTQDVPGRPFATDAGKYALYCTAVAAALCAGFIPMPARLHLHDWHCGFFAMLRYYVNEYEALKQVPVVLSIHNLAMQGIRPLRNDISSLEAWFPALLRLPHHMLNPIIDPRYHDCVNPLRAAITLSDAVHLVSPGYAEEVLEPSKHEQGFFGGEGLEQDLRNIQLRGKLYGILNGCEYPQEPTSEKVREQTKRKLVSLANEALMYKLGFSETVHPSELIAQIRLFQQRRPKSFLMTSVGRLTDQKMLLLRQPWQGRIVLDAVLTRLKQWDEKARFWLLGSGDDAIARQFSEVAARHDNFLFINGYHEELSDALYLCGDLFMMPSSFEPCGISQMLALREAQPCLVHSVGGLRDTVVDGKNGFGFSGDNLQEQTSELLNTLDRALSLYGTDAWKVMVKNAGNCRFEWQASAKRYVDELYGLN